MGLKPIKVSQANKYIQRIIQNDPLLGDLTIVGEISNLTYHNSGHVYFSLKDEKSKIHCFFPSYHVEKLHFLLEEGMEIQATGSISVYEARGQYSLMINHVELEGQGSFAIAFETIKKKLEAEGLFDSSYKKELPFFPRKIGIITAQTGAAIEDIKKTILKKNKVVNLFLYPTLVQGDKAAKEIKEAIEELNQHHRDLDLIILGRGGGSIEDLWAFNEEMVARAIFLSKIPIVTGIGHETDFTISDFVSDVRGETPTAAAELAVPNIGRLKEHLEDKQDQMKQQMLRIHKEKEERVKTQDISFFKRLVEEKIGYYNLRINQSRERNKEQIVRLCEKEENHLALAYEKLKKENPYFMIDKGFIHLKNERGEKITSVAHIKEGDKLYFDLADGQVFAVTKEVRKNK